VRSGPGKNGQETKKKKKKKKRKVQWSAEKSNELQ
jgi:hypothetical protein